MRALFSLSVGDCSAPDRQRRSIGCVADSGSGKTTTLVARIAWLIAEGTDPSRITAVTFNKRAAEELTARLGTAIPDAPAPVRVRTFHALGLEILRETGETASPILDRAEILLSVLPTAPSSEHRRLDTVFSRLKLDLDVDVDRIAADLDAGPVARAFMAYEQALAAAGGLDFDDLVARALHLLERNPAVLAVWRERCAHLLVDEAQDLDRMQLRMALLLAAPANRVFFVGDDDQSIYGWRLPDVRRLLGLAESSLPDLIRVDLETNYRCPGVVIDRAVRMIEHNTERFAKVIRARPDAPGRLILAPTDRRARRRHRVRAPVVAGRRRDPGRARPDESRAAARSRGLPGRGHPVPRRGPRAPPREPGDRPLLQRADAAGPASPLLVRLHDAGGPPDVLASLLAWAARYRDLVSLLAWAARYRDLVSLRDDVEAARARLARLRRDDSALTLATAHGTKGLEFDQVNILSNPMTHPQSGPSGAYSGASRFAVRLDGGSVVSGRLPPKPGTSVRTLSGHSVQTRPDACA